MVDLTIEHKAEARLQLDTLEQSYKDIHSSERYICTFRGACNISVWCMCQLHGACDTKCCVRGVRIHFQVQVGLVSGFGGHVNAAQHLTTSADCLTDSFPSWSTRNARQYRDSQGPIGQLWAYSARHLLRNRHTNCFGFHLSIFSFYFEIFMGIKQFVPTDC